MLANIFIYYLIASLANWLPVFVHQTGPGTHGQVVTLSVPLASLFIHDRQATEVQAINLLL